MKNTYETVGDVREDVDALLAVRGLQVTGGSFYHHTQGITFGLADRRQDRVGDVHCLLPEGWLSNSYWPEFLGEPTAPNDQLKLNVIKGAGRLILPQASNFAIQEGFEANVSLGRDGSTQYQLINTADQLLVVQAQSTLYPQNETDINPSEIDELDGSIPLASDVVFTHAQTFQPDGSVELQWMR